MKKTNRTKIEYLDYTDNPIVGCSGVGCAVRKVCWARGQAKRAKHRCSLCYDFVPHVHFERFDGPLKVKNPSRIGYCFMGDFFDKQISEAIRRQLKDVMRMAYWHTFVVFTKQPQNIDLDEYIPANMWVGVSVNHQKDDWRIDVLRQVPTSVRIVSFEPLYEHIEADLMNIQWVIIGAQRRPNHQPKQDWVVQLVRSARVFGSAVFLKNNLFPQPMAEHYQEYPKLVTYEELMCS